MDVRTTIGRLLFEMESAARGKIYDILLLEIDYREDWLWL